MAASQSAIIQAGAQASSGNGSLTFRNDLRPASLGSPQQKCVEVCPGKGVGKIGPPPPRIQKATEKSPVEAFTNRNRLKARIQQQSFGYSRCPDYPMSRCPDPR